MLLLIDEAQNLAPDTLEQVRLLSNLETDTSKLIQIILIGQPELDAMLESPDLRQLRQRISVRWRLSPLSATETRDYVRHRLRIAAGAPREIFTELALREVHRRSRGIPRLVNLLCDRALLAGYAAEAKTIGLGLVTQSDKEIRGSARSLATPPRASQLVRWLPSGLRQVAGAALLVALGVGAAAAWQRLAAPPASEADEAAAPESAPAQPTPESVGAAEPAALGAELAAAELTAAEAAIPAPLSVAGEPAPAVFAAASGDVAAAPPAALPAAAVDSALSAALSPSAPGPPPPVVAPLPLEDALAAASPAAATSDSLRDLLRRWGAPDDVPPFLKLEEALERLRGAQIAVLSLRDANRATLELFNHASFLQLRALDGAPRTVLLAGLEGDRATLVGLRGREELTVPWSDVEEHWTGELVVAWRDFAGLPEVIAPGIGDTGVAWLQSTLETLGFLGTGDRTGVFDAATASAVREFQKSRQLTVDGTVGPLTKAMLYEALPDFAIPRLGVRGGSAFRTSRRSGRSVELDPEGVAAAPGRSRHGGQPRAEARAPGSARARSRGAAARRARARPARGRAAAVARAARDPRGADRGGARRRRARGVVARERKPRQTPRRRSSRRRVRRPRSPPSRHRPRRRRAVPRRWRRRPTARAPLPPRHRRVPRPRRARRSRRARDRSRPGSEPPPARRSAAPPDDGRRAAALPGRRAGGEGGGAGSRSRGARAAAAERGSGSAARRDPCEEARAGGGGRHRAPGGSAEARREARSRAEAGEGVRPGAEEGRGQGARRIRRRRRAPHRLAPEAGAARRAPPAPGHGGAGRGARGRQREVVRREGDRAVGRGARARRARAAPQRRLGRQRGLADRFEDERTGSDRAD